MKEHPILFSAAMVRAILAGTKTQTRRVVKLPIIDKDFGCELSGGELAASQRDTLRHCPYGLPGDRLWVKETWAPNSLAPAGAQDRPPYVCYRANGDTASRWRPSIFMPRWASRLTLEITAIRVERLQDISEEDALSEGVEPYVPRETGMLKGRDQELPSEAYRTLWQSINGPGSWDVNPWVWVITFRRVQP